MDEQLGSLTASREAAQRMGVRAEALVVRQLVAEGWTVLARNWVGAGGELDIVAARGDRLRFVEVKARTNPAVDPLDAVHPAKQRRIAAAAGLFLDSFTGAASDVAVAVALVDCTIEPWVISWMDDAFDAGGRSGR